MQADAGQQPSMLCQRPVTEDEGCDTGVGVTDTTCPSGSIASSWMSELARKTGRRISDDVGGIGSANPCPIFQPAADSMHLPGLPEGSVRNELNKRPGSVHTSGDTSAPYNQVSAFRISSPRSIHVLLV